MTLDGETSDLSMTYVGLISLAPELTLILFIPKSQSLFAPLLALHRYEHWKTSENYE